MEARRRMAAAVVLLAGTAWTGGVAAQTATATKPDAAAAKAEFDAAGREFKQLVSDMTVLQAQYHQPQADQDAIEAKFKEASTKAVAASERFEAAALALAVADPKNAEARQISSESLKGAVRADAAEVALEKAAKLDAAGVADGEVCSVAAAAAVVLSRLDEAAAWIAKAKAAGARKDRLAELEATIDHDRLNGLMRSFAALLQDTVVAERNGRPVLAVKAGAAAQLPGLVHDSSASGSTVFIEPQAVIPLGNRIRQLEGQEREAEQAVLQELSTLVAAELPALDHLQQVLMQLDAALARARYGQWMGAVRPELEGDPLAPLQLEELRHPLLLWQERRDGGAAVVPVSVRVDGGLRVVAITGPNTGGKTVTLKSVGLAALMARAGLFVPCAGTPRLPWCRQVLADIGDEQSLQQNLSTFSGHVRRIARILEALPRLTIATTHFGELKALKYSDDRFENASVAFDVETLSPTYRLQWGIPGRSNALAIASRLGLDGAVLEQAQGLLAPRGEGEVNQVIAGLENQRQRQQEAAEEAAALLARTELLHEELLERWQQQKQQSAELQEQRRLELERSIRDGQQEVRRIIRRLRQGRDVDTTRLGETARRAGQRLKSLQQQHRPAPERRDHQGWLPKLGDRVRVLSLGKAGEVLALSADGRELTVRCGVMRLNLELSAIEGLNGEKPAPPPPPQVAIRSSRRLGGGGPQVRTERNTVDVRGLRVHEAEAAVEDQLRTASGPLWVIHGIGTGKLKRGLREWLATLPYVERVSDADQGDGGAGCSVIWPK